MLNKMLYSIVLSFGLAACATNATPKLSQAQYNPKMLAGQWGCQAKFADNMDYVFDVVYQADGTSHDKGILTVKLDEEMKDLVWQFEVQTQNKWWIDGAYLFEQQIAKPIVKILPIEKQSTRLLLKVFEKSNPDVLEMKNEILKNLSELDEEENKAKIITLNDKTFQIELDVNDTAVNSICQRT